MDTDTLQSFEALPTPSNYFEGVRSADPLHVDNVLLFYRQQLIEEHKRESMRWLHSRHILVTNFGKAGITHVDMIPYKVEQYSAILIRPYELHFFTALEDSLSSWLFMTFDSDTPLAFKTNGNPVVALSQLQRKRLQQLANWSIQRKYRSLHANELIAQTTVLLESLRPQWIRRKQSQKNPSSGSSSALLAQISRSLKRNPALSLSISQLAAQSGCSERHLRRIFLELTGMPLGEFLKEYRISRIIQLVGRDGHSLATAASICGYSAPSALSRVFKKRTGLTPREFFRAS